MGSQSCNEVAFMSAPISPRRSCSLNNSMYYYSAPTSPSVKIDHNASFDVEYDPTMPISVPKGDSKLEDFEFETSRRYYLDGFEVEKSQNFEYLIYQLDHGDPLPSMAFADELFSDGQVAPLKLPPRLQGDKKKSGCLSSTASSPKSPSSVFKLSFSRKNSWKDDFDPFKSALDTVRDEKRGMIQENTQLRARSQSPLRTIHQPWSSESKILDSEQQKPIQFELSKPKSWGIAKQLRPLQVGHENPIIKKRESDSQEGKKEGKKGLLFRSASVKYKVHDKIEKRSIIVCKTVSTRKMGFKSGKELAHCNGEKRGDREIKSIVQYRPKLFLCLGFRSKGARK